VANRNVLVFTFFLFLSFIFWYLNSLGKDLETDIKYPVRYVNVPKNRTLPDDLPNRLNLLLKGPGYSILQLKISGTKTPVEIDLSRVGPKRYLNGKSADYYIVTSDLVQNLNSQLKSVCKIISVKPDTLFFSLGNVLK
jgi:hypothetical protein